MCIVFVDLQYMNNIIQFDFLTALWSKEMGQKTQYNFKMSQLKNLLRFNMRITHRLTYFLVFYPFLISFTVLTFKPIIAKVYFPQCIKN